MGASRYSQGFLLYSPHFSATASGDIKFGSFGGQGLVILSFGLFS